MYRITCLDEYGALHNEITEPSYAKAIDMFKAEVEAAGLEDNIRLDANNDLVALGMPIYDEVTEVRLTWEPDLPSETTSLLDDAIERFGRAYVETVLSNILGKELRRRRANASVKL